MNLWGILIAMGVVAVVLVIKDGLNAFKYFEDLEDEESKDTDNKLDDVFGSWPGDETDDEIAAALRDEKIKEATKEAIKEDKDLLNRLKG